LPVINRRNRSQSDAGITFIYKLHAINRFCTRPINI